ncbi:vacuolar protein sorting-associated protein 33A [Lepeophtheirus salmonis]|uniref:Vacuolar protein sorting 33 homolog A (S. cerevisiae) [Callithrix jacchus] n=1 Tax=Lepeophtheirus salmonis TaxID=72036 RepID=A0A0K2T2M1_LEPSM|nr:vacuolar protein sorting-associated protein 33A-like [Lepeophtheirus salmonis]XP_040573211.1 vacuolar protein sorting-associated protein 33A-like [Lepeophtheirus salmonis]
MSSIPSSAGSSARSHFSCIRDLSKKELSECLDKYAGSKVIVWDEALIGPLGLIAEYQFLRDRHVKKMIPLKLGPLKLEENAENIVFITRPLVPLMDIVADNVKNSEDSRKAFHILFLPRKSLLCEMRLKDKGVFGSFTFLDQLSASWFPLETDVISMEDSSIFSEYYLNGDPTSLHSVAKALMALQSIVGIIPKVYGKGKAAKQVYDYMTRLRKEAADEESNLLPSDSSIDTLVIIDRQIDSLSPLATQLTYEGLIDEIYSIKHASVKIPADRFEPNEKDKVLSVSEKEMKQCFLNSNEELFAEIRDKNFNAVGHVINKKAKWMAAQFNERHEAKSIKEIKSFVEKLPQMQAIKTSLMNHTSIAESIRDWTNRTEFLDALQIEQELMNYQNVDKLHESIEDLICANADILRVLRLICIQSFITSGLKPKILESYRKLILQNYGYQHLLSLLNLEKAGLLYPMVNGSNKSNYVVLRKKLNLTLDDVNEQDPKDIAYVYSVYAPISIRLVQHLSFSPGGWRSIRDVLDILPGPTLEEKQNSMGKSKPKLITTNNVDSNNSTTLVVFVGGVTFAEISALRYLAQKEESSTDYLIATTSIINGNNFLESMMSNIKEGAPF